MTCHQRPKAATLAEGKREAGIDVMTTSALPFCARWDHRQLSRTDLDDHAATAFEWWYFDLATEDGLELVVVYGFRNPIFCPGKVSVFLELKDDRRHILRVRNYPASSFSESYEGHSMRLVFAGGQTLCMKGEDDAMVWSLAFDIAGIQGDLSVKPRNRGFLPGADGRYMFDADSGQRSCVSFSSPATEVSGALTVDGQHRTIVAAPGYHDHPWGTAQLMMTNRKWQWARARRQGVSVMFAQVLPQPGYEGGLDFLYRGEPGKFEPTIVHGLTLASRDWSRDHFYGIRFPHAVAVESSLGSWIARSTGSLLDTPIYNRASINWEPESDGVPGRGWLEYYHVPPWLRRPLRFLARFGALFIRRFPYIGQ